MGLYRIATFVQVKELLHVCLPFEFLINRASNAMLVRNNKNAPLPRIGSLVLIH